jgi:hypothetical protein
MKIIKKLSRLIEIWQDHCHVGLQFFLFLCLTWSEEKAWKRAQKSYRYKRSII